MTGMAVLPVPGGSVITGNGVVLVVVGDGGSVIVGNGVVVVLAASKANRNDKKAY